MRHGMRGLRILATAGAIAVAGLLFAAFGPTLIGARSLIVTSGSMEPALPVGSVAITRTVDARAIAVGDIITFRRPGADRPTTHRVTALTIDDAGRMVFTTKGDANATRDPEPAIVSGPIERVVRQVPYAGSIVGFARSPVGALALIGIPIIGLSVDAGRRRRRGADAAVIDGECHTCGAVIDRTLAAG